MEAILNNSVQENLLMSIGEKNDFEFEIRDKWLLIYKEFKKESKSYIQYKMQIDKFYNYMIDRKKIYNEENLLKSITSDDAESYSLYIKSQDYKKSTVNQIIQVAKEYYEYLSEMKFLVDRNVFKIVKKYSANEVLSDTRDKYLPTRQEILDLIEACNTKIKWAKNFEYNSAKNKAIISILANCGCRPMELLESEKKHLKEKKDYYTLFIPKEICKTKIDRTICISGKAYLYLKSFLVEKKKRPKCEKSKLLIPSQNGNLINSTDANDMLFKLNEIVGIKVPEGLQFSCYCFRHFCATTLKEERNIDEFLINLNCGWTTKGMLGRYTNHFDKYEKKIAKMCDIL